MPAIHIYLATNNSHKAEEIAALLHALGAPCVVQGAHSIGGMPPVDENADSFEGNARLKALALLEQLQTAHNAGFPATQSAAPTDNPQTTADTRAARICYVLADDSGLSVGALGGAPGIHSARYAGAHASDAANNALLLKNLANVPLAERCAAFVCCFALLGTDGSEAVFHGRCEGTIADAVSGAGGFGYDPLFIPAGYERSFAELGSTLKNTLSHRTRCCEQLAALLGAMV